MKRIFKRKGCHLLTKHSVSEVSVFFDDLLGDINRSGSLSGFGTVGLHLHFDNLKGIHNNGLRHSGTEAR